MSDSTFGFLLMVPALLVLLVVIAFPILKGIYASFCDYGLKELRKGIFDLKWNNFANYKIMLQNNQIFSYFKNTFVFVALVVVIQLILGMGIALLLDSKIKARGTLRGLMLVPWTIPSVVTAIVWRFMTNSSYGVINWIAYKLGMIPTLDYSWTLQSGSAMALIVIAAVWRQLPYMMVMILAGLQSVDKSLLEAGTIDGANYWQSLLHITIPSIRPVLITSIWIALMANITVMWVLARILGGIVTDGLSAALAVDALAQAALPLAAAIIVRAASIYLAQRAGDKAAFEAVRRVRSLVYDKLTALGPSYTETVPTAEAVQTSVEGATQLQVYFGGYLPQLFFAGLAPITLFVLLVGQAGLPAALLLACVPVIPISIMMVMRNAKKIGAEYWGSYVDLGGMFLEAVQGLTTLKVYQADRSWHERINAESERFRTATMRLLVMQLRSICVMDLVVYMGAALGIIVAALQLATGKIGFEAAFLIVFLSQEFFLPMRRLESLFHTAMNGMAASRRMFGILDTPEPERGDVELDGRGDIELAGVSYAYGDRTVLDSASATIAHGSLVALVGESGGGKSTLAGIIAGRKGAYRGSVRIGGVELRDATAASLMRAVTLVPTNGYLFAGTLRDNLLLAQPNATDTELLRALDRTRVAAFVQANGGLDMVINEGGTNLSGGQRQRVCMARALLHDSPIYVFDEATSNVDAASEAAIGEVIASLAGKHTVIVVAHRLSTIVGADQILVLERGRIAEHGTHGELLATAGAYARMWNSQEQLSAYAYAEGDAEDAGAVEAVDGSTARTDGLNGAGSSSAAAVPDSGRARRSAPSIM